MPRNQEALRRYRIIHSVLRRGGKHKSSRIAEICVNAGIQAGYRTIQKDLQDLRTDPTLLGKCLPIEKDNSSKSWYYSEIPKDIFPILELDDEEVSALIFYAKTLNQYRDYPMFNEINNALGKVIDNSNISKELKSLFTSDKLLQAEKHPPIHGIDLIIPVLESIHRRTIIEVKYKKFVGDKEKSHRIYPLLLKEDKHFWYLIGKSVDKDRIITLALDRVVDLIDTGDVFDEIEFDFENYHKHSFGITVMDQDPLEIRISFTPSQGKYIKSLPIHSTQEIVEDSKENFIIKVMVKPSYEFYSKIMSYGSDAIVLSPEEVKVQIYENLEEAISHYKSID